MILVQQLEGNVLSPLLLSRAISFPPVVTLLLTTSAAVVLGVLGMFLVVPVVGAAVAAVRRYRDVFAGPMAAASGSADGTAAGEPAPEPG